MMMTKAAASGGWDGKTSGMLMRRCSALWLINFMRSLLLFICSPWSVRVLFPCCFWLAAAHVPVCCVCYRAAMSASTKEFRDRDHVVDKYLHTIHTYPPTCKIDSVLRYRYYGPVSGFAACTAGHSLFDRTKTKNDYYDILRVSQRLYSRECALHSWVFILIYLVFCRVTRMPDSGADIRNTHS